MLHSVPVLSHSVRSAARRTLARRSPLAVTSGSRNLAGSSGRQSRHGVDAAGDGSGAVVTTSSISNYLLRREYRTLKRDLELSLGQDPSTTPYGSAQAEARFPTRSILHQHLTSSLAKLKDVAAVRLQFFHTYESADDGNQDSTCSDSARIS